MNTKKLILQVIGLAFTLWLLAGCGSTATAPATLPAPSSSSPVDFTGHWEDAASAFSLDLSQNGEQLQGSHVVVAQQGSKIDSLDKSIEGSIQGKTAVVHFQSSFTANSGIAQITFIDANTILWKVTNPPDGEYYLPNEATLVKKSPASNPSPAKSGTITGRVHLMAPPTPHMIVYAVDQATGLWAFTETNAADSEVPFSLAVPQGSYQVYAFMDNGGFTAYSLDGISLTIVTVAENQTVSGIEVGPPGQSECGNMFGVPASPDGRFAAVPGPAADCIAAILTPAAGSSQPQTNLDATRIQFQPNTTDWYTPGDLAPNTTIRFVLDALQGQQMTVDLTTDPDSSAIPYASLYIVAADGTVYTPNPTTSWSGILPASQSYYIEVRSMAQQSINYTLRVAIPAVGSTPYMPVTPAVCQILQEMATQSLSITFTMEASAPFTDPLSGETGQGCVLTAMATGLFFSDPNSVAGNLVNGFLGWTEQTAYQASGPTGAATAMTRDMALMLIRVEWIPSPDAQCPTNQPISACILKPEQKLYTIAIQAAMK